MVPVLLIAILVPVVVLILFLISSLLFRTVILDGQSRLLNWFLTMGNYSCLRLSRGLLVMDG